MGSIPGSPSRERRSVADVAARGLAFAGRCRIEEGGGSEFEDRVPLNEQANLPGTEGAGLQGEQEQPIGGNAPDRVRPDVLGLAPRVDPAEEVAPRLWSD